MLIDRVHAPLASCILAPDAICYFKSVRLLFSSPRGIKPSRTVLLSKSTVCALASPTGNQYCNSDAPIVDTS